MPPADCELPSSTISAGRAYDLLTMLVQDGAGSDSMSRRRLPCPARAQVARLVAVMDERKVFGSSGARFMKELLAEADSRSKKLSARSGGAVQSNGAAAPAGALRACATTHVCSMLPRVAFHCADAAS